MSATVWICKHQALRRNTGLTPMDFSPAEAYGKIRFITKGDMPGNNLSHMRPVWAREVMEFMAEYNPLTDFIVATGQPSSIFAIGHALGIAGKTPRFLVWSHEDNHYRILDGVAMEAEHV